MSAHRYDPAWLEQKAKEAEATRESLRPARKSLGELYRIAFDILNETDAGQNVRKFAEPDGLTNAVEILRKAGL